MIAQTSSFGEWASDLLDRLRERFGVIVKPPSTFLRWVLTIVVPFVTGVLAKDLILEHNQAGTLFSLAIWGQHLVVVPLTALYIFGLLWQRFVRYRLRHADRIYHALGWFYEEIGFDRGGLDVRCTIWVPVNHDKSTIRLQQLVDYVPRKSQVPGGNEYRVNGKAGRVFRFSRRSGRTELPIGNLGQCALHCITTHRPEAVCYNDIPDGPDFVTLMVRDFNFTQRRARRLIPNRRSYLSLPIMDAGHQDLLGILYLDSSEPNGVNPRTKAKAEKYLPRFAELLTK